MPVFHHPDRVQLAREGSLSRTFSTWLLNVWGERPVVSNLTVGHPLAISVAPRLARCERPPYEVIAVGSTFVACKPLQHRVVSVSVGKLRIGPKESSRALTRRVSSARRRSYASSGTLTRAQSVQSTCSAERHARAAPGGAHADAINSGEIRCSPGSPMAKADAEVAARVQVRWAARRTPSSTARSPGGTSIPRARQAPSLRVNQWSRSANKSAAPAYSRTQAGERHQQVTQPGTMG